MSRENGYATHRSPSLQNARERAAEENGLLDLAAIPAGGKPPIFRAAVVFGNPSHTIAVSRRGAAGGRPVN